MDMGLCLGGLRHLVMDRETWYAAVHGVAKSQTWRSNWTELNWLLLELSVIWLCFNLWKINVYRDNEAKPNETYLLELKKKFS